MSAASGFKRLGLVMVAVAAVAVGALAVLSALVPRDTIREAVMAEIRTATGLDLALRGHTAITLFPSSDASFYDVHLGDADTGMPALSARRLTARLRLFPLLLGRVEIGNVELIEPTISVRLAEDGRSNWAGLLDTLARTLKPNASKALFSEIRVVDGTIVFRARGVTEQLNDVDLSLAWPSISESFAATGRFVWRHEPIDASIGLSDFLAALGGTPTGLKLRLSGKPIKVAFDGHMSSAPTLRIDGKLAADAASLRDALRWMGQRPLPGGGFGRFALKAQTRVAGGAVALTGVNVELDGNSAEGVLTFAGGRRRSLQGTLAANRLNLTPYISTVRLLAGRRNDWSALPISLDGLKNTDLDLRISAAEVVVASAKFDRTAIAANLRNGDLVVTVGEAQAFGGIIKGSFGLASTAQGANIKAQLNFADVDLERCLDAIFDMNRIQGTGTLSLRLDATGDSVLALARSVSGSADLKGKSGALKGVNVEQLLRRLERRPLSGGGDFRTGRTPFDTFSAAMIVHQGTVKVDDMQVHGAAVKIALGGNASIPLRELDLKGTASLVAARDTADRTPPFELPFVVQGRWEDPIMLPDPDILIRRSGAAAPLLNAVRDRRDAIRSAIDRLTGRPAPGIKPVKAAD